MQILSLLIFSATFNFLLLLLPPLPLFPTLLTVLMLAEEIVCHLEQLYIFVNGGLRRCMALWKTIQLPQCQMSGSLINQDMQLFKKSWGKHGSDRSGGGNSSSSNKRMEMAVKVRNSSRQHDKSHAVSTAGTSTSRGREESSSSKVCLEERTINEGRGRMGLDSMPMLTSNCFPLHWTPIKKGQRRLDSGKSEFKARASRFNHLRPFSI